MTEPAPAPPPTLTAARYLALGDVPDLRHELVDGVVRAMAQGSPTHGGLIFQVGALLTARLKPPCRPLGAVNVVTRRDPERGDTVRGPDLAVACGPVADLAAASVAPVLVVEVLSPSTRNEDLGAKLGEYKELPAVREIWLADGERRWVEVWVRGPDGWVGAGHLGRGRFTSPQLDGPVTLDEVYRDLR